MEDAKNEKALTRAQALAILCCMVGTESVGVADDSEIESRNCPALVRQLEAVLGVGALPFESTLRRHGHGFAPFGKVDEVKGLRGLCDLLREVADAVAPVQPATVTEQTVAGVRMTIIALPGLEGRHPTLLLRLEIHTGIGYMSAEFPVTLVGSDPRGVAVYCQAAENLLRCKP